MEEIIQILKELDWSPLFISLKTGVVATFISFFLGIFAARKVVKATPGKKAVIDGILTLPMVLPPTVCGYFLLVAFSPRRVLGSFLAAHGIRFVMSWYGGILAAVVVAYPLMYRTARGAFESFDESLAYSGQTLGLSNTYIFWRIRMPACRQGILSGVVLAFARALGEYGATTMLIGYTPGRTATISTTVYQLWRTGDDSGAFFWVMVNLAISVAVLLVVNLMERRQKEQKRLWA